MRDWKPRSKRAASASQTLAKQIKADAAADIRPRANRLGRPRLGVGETLDLWSLFEQRFAVIDNVRLAPVFVAREEAPLGADCSTDAKSEPEVKIVATFAENAHPKILYTIASTSAARGETAAARCLAFPKEAEAKAAFQRYGFTILAHERRAEMTRAASRLPSPSLIGIRPQRRAIRRCAAPRNDGIA
jgi:ABC-type molybdate transport system substrate-binding protein